MIRNKLASKTVEICTPDHLNGVQVVGRANPLTPTIVLASNKPLKGSKIQLNIELANKTFTSFEPETSSINILSLADCLKCGEYRKNCYNNDSESA